MLQRNLSEDNIYNIALSFRSAIIAARLNDEFSSKDRMWNFPRGCCDDSCDLLAYYFYDKYKIYTEQGNGVYRDNNPYNTTNHSWLIMGSDLFIDITGDQFKVCAGFVEEVYVGKENLFYKRLEDRRIYENYNIIEDERLWNDYLIITSHMPDEIL